MTIQTAQPELLTLAAAMRGEDWADDLAAALIAARNAGWDWPKAFAFAARLLADDDAHPRDMTAAARNPLQHQDGSDPTDEYERLRALAAPRERTP